MKTKKRLKHRRNIASLQRTDIPEGISQWEAEVFLREVKQAKTSGHFTRTIQKWWEKAFKDKPFPSGHQVGEYVSAVQYQLMMNYMEAVDEEFSDRFIKNYNAAVNFNNNGYHDPSLIKSFCACFGDLTLNLKHTRKGDKIMAKTKKAKKVKNTQKEKGEKKITIGGTIDALIVENKFTDEEILTRVHKAFPDAPAYYIGCERRAINTGMRENQGFAKPKKPYERIGGKVAKTKTKKAPVKKIKKTKKKK